MKVHKVTLSIIDFDGLGAAGVGDVLTNVRYPNDCIAPSLVSVETRDIGEWSDEHPLNRESTAAAELERLFAAPEERR